MIFSYAGSPTKKKKKRSDKEEMDESDNDENEECETEDDQDEEEKSESEEGEEESDEDMNEDDELKNGDDHRSQVRLIAHDAEELLRTLYSKDGKDAVLNINYDNIKNVDELIEFIAYQFNHRCAHPELMVIICDGTRHTKNKMDRDLMSNNLESYQFKNYNNIIILTQEMIRKCYENISKYKFIKDVQFLASLNGYLTETPSWEFPEELDTSRMSIAEIRHSAEYNDKGLRVLKIHHLEDCSEITKAQLPSKLEYGGTGDGIPHCDESAAGDIIWMEDDRTKALKYSNKFGELKHLFRAGFRRIDGDSKLQLVCYAMYFHMLGRMFGEGALWVKNMKIPSKIFDRAWTSFKKRNLDWQMVVAGARKSDGAPKSATTLKNNDFKLDAKGYDLVEIKQKRQELFIKKSSGALTFFGEFDNDIEY